jgi:parvulin-like peptidyl-prolyl isomerase
MPRLLRACALLPFLLLPLTSSLRAADAPDDSTVIAKVGDEDVTLGEIRTDISNLDANTQAQLQHNPQALDQAVKMLLAKKLVLQEALAKKWDENPVVTAALARLREDAIGQTYLQSVSQPPETYPSDAEVQAVYDANKSRLLVPRTYDLAQIFVKDAKDADPTAAAKAEAKLASVRKALAADGADFAAVASAESDDAPSAAKGGEIGTVAENQIAPEIRSAIGNLDKGTVTKPIRLDDGYHILKVLSVKEPYTPSLDQIKTQLVQKMRQQKAQLNSQQYVSDLMKENPVQIDELSLSRVFKQQ